MWKLELRTDWWPEDISWEVTSDVSGAVVVERDLYTDRNTVHEDTACLPEGCYTFVINDSWGDGLTNNGYYTGFLNGQAIAGFTGSNYGPGDTKEFCVGAGATIL